MTYRYLLIGTITFVLLGLFASNAPLYFSSSDNPYLTQITMVELVEEESSDSKQFSKIASGNSQDAWIGDYDEFFMPLIGEPISSGLLRPLYHPEKVTPPPR